MQSGVYRLSYNFFPVCVYNIALPHPPVFNDEKIVSLYMLPFLCDINDFSTIENSIIRESIKLCSHFTIKPVSFMAGMGSTNPHYTQFHPTQFHLVPPETSRRVGFKLLRFIEHTNGYIADVSY